MPPLAIVENLNVLENVAPGFVAGQVIAMMHQFGLQGMEKALNLLFLEPLKSVSGWTLHLGWA